MTEVPVGVLVNEPVVMTNGDRKGSVLLLGGLYRLKLDSSQIVKAGDRIKLTPKELLSIMRESFLHFILLQIRMNTIISIVSK